MLKFERNLINRHYTHSTNPRPVWRCDRAITTQVFEFDCIDLDTWEVKGKTRLYWKHEVDYRNPVIDPLYHNCSWRFGGYNPTPVTDWFRGLPKQKMFDWCRGHGLIDMKCVGQYTDYYFSDACIWDECNNEWRMPSRRRINRI